MRLIIDNYVITKPIIDILKFLKSQLSNGKLRDIRLRGDEIQITCPFHSDGLEKRASCFISIAENIEIEMGTFHCFTCGEKGPFYKFVGQCFDKDDEYGKRWLIDNFGDEYIESQLYIDDDIDLSCYNVIDKKYLDESILDNYQNYHPYMQKRKLSKSICEKFNIKYDPKSESIIFPVYDEDGKLVFLTRRSINNKTFIIDKDVEKPVYLLNEIIKNNIKEVLVCESQINALTAWSWDIPAIALFGTGTSNQYDILNKTNIKHYILAFDGDDAGDKGTNRFIKNIRKDVFIDILKVPRGKDINDLSKEEFEDLMKML